VGGGEAVFAGLVGSAAGLAIGYALEQRFGARQAQLGAALSGEASRSRSR
jgi:hypothetical protein